MTTLLDQSIALIQNLQQDPSNNTELDQKAFKYLIDQFNNIKKTTPDISQEDLVKQSNILISILKQCPFAPPPAPVVKPGTKIPAMPKAKPKEPKKKDWTELEDKCKELPDKIRAGQKSEARVLIHNNKPTFDKELDLLQPDKPTFDWGIKFTYDPSEQNFGLTCIPNTGSSLANSEDKQEWYMTLLPAMKSQTPKSPGMDTPNAMPGLQFQLKSNIAKHRIPGSQPVYQHLGIDTVMITIVGCFTGDGGKKIRTTSTDMPINYANNLNPNTGPDGKPVSSIKLTEEEQRILDVANSVAARAKIKISRDILISVIHAQTKILIQDIRILIFNIERKGYVWRQDLKQFISVDNFKNYLNKPEEQKINNNNSAITTIPGEKLTSKTKVNNEGVNTTWMKDVNMYECEPCQGVVPQTERLDSYHEFTSFQRLSYNKELEVEINLAKNIDSRAPKKNKYEEWGWDSTSAKVQKDADWGPLRNGENGNPRFKGVIRGMEAYYARHDRTWYLMTLEVTDLGLSSDVPLNLIKELTEAAEAAVQDVKETEGTAKALTDPNERLDCILQQGNGTFTAPDDVLGTTNRAYIAGNIAGGGELIAWDMYTGEGMKYKMEEVQENGKNIKYAKASSSVLTPYEVAKELASTKVNLISAASGGVRRIRVDSDVKKQFFVTMYERGAIDYKPHGIGEDVLQSEIQGNIATNNNAEAEKAFQQLCSSFYSTSKRVGDSNPGAQNLDNEYKLLTSMTLSEVASNFKESKVGEAQLGVLINEWTSPNTTFTKDKGIKIFQDLRMITQGTCKGFAFARSDVPGSQWKVITPYGLFKQVLTEMNSNTEADLNFLLEYIDIKTNPFQSGYVAYVDGSGSNDPGLKNRNQQVACFDTTRGDMDPNTPGIQSIRDVNDGQYNQYDPLAAGDSIPLDGLNPIQYIIGVLSAGISCGADFLLSIASFLAGLFGAPATAGASVAGTVVSAGLGVLAAATCADTLGNLQAAAVGKREYDTWGGVIDLVTAFIPEAFGRKPVREGIKRFFGWLGKVDVIKVLGKGILDAFQTNTNLRDLAKKNPAGFIGDIWTSLINKLTKEAGVPDGDPTAAILADRNFFQRIWDWITGKGGKIVSTLFNRLVEYDNNPNLTNIRNVIKGNKTDAAFLANLDTHVPPTLPKDLKAGDVVVTHDGDIFIVKELMTDGTNYKGITLMELSNPPNGTEFSILPTHPIHDYLYKANELLAKESDIISLPLPSPVIPTPIPPYGLTKIKERFAASNGSIIRQLQKLGINPSIGANKPIPGDTLIRFGDGQEYITVEIAGELKAKNILDNTIHDINEDFYKVSDLSRVRIPVPPVNTNSTDVIVNKLTSNDTSIVNELTAVGIKPISTTNLPSVGDSIIKIGDDTTVYKVTYADNYSIMIQSTTDSTKNYVVNASHYYNIKDLEKVLTQPSNPAFSPVVNSPTNPVAPPDPAIIAGSGTSPTVTGNVIFGNSNNYINTVISKIPVTTGTSPTSTQVYQAYSDTWNSILNNNIASHQEKSLIAPINPKLSFKNAPSMQVNTMFNGQQYINQSGQVLTFKDIDSAAQTVRFTLVDNTIISISLDSTEKLFNIVTPLSPNIEQVLITHLTTNP